MNTFDQDNPKPVGRPRTGTNPMQGVRMSPELLGQIDDWRKKEADKPSLAESIRRLVELGLRWEKAKDRLKNTIDSETRKRLKTFGLRIPDK